MEANHEFEGYNGDVVVAENIEEPTKVVETEIVVYSRVALTISNVASPNIIDEKN